MANKSDEIIKRELGDIGNVDDLKLRIFPGGSREDQKHWVDGGLAFGYDNVMYGSCDGAWYRDGPWADPLSKRKSDAIPVVAVEGTLALERGSSGNAQYQRFFHALGAVLSGVVGVYYLRSGTVPIRYDLPQAALNASDMHGVDYLVIDKLTALQEIVEALASNTKEQYDKVAKKLKAAMAGYFGEFLKRKFGGDIEAYYRERSIIRLPKMNIKYLGTGNYRNFTESSQRGGHIVLGEFLMAKYILKEPFFFLLPRLLPSEIEKLDNSNKKEWLVLRKDEVGKLITLDDLSGVDPSLKKHILALKDHPLGGSEKGGKDKVKWNKLMEILENDIRSGKIKIKV